MTKKRKNNDDQGTISGVLPWLSRDKGWEKQLDQNSVIVNWRDIVGEEFREHAEPLKIERGVLWLEVENSSWLQQFQYAKIELVENLNRCLKLTSIKDIKMVLPKGDVVKKIEKSGPTVTFVRPSAEKISAFQQQAGCISDEKCREALVQFWYLAEACRREKK